MVDAAGGLLIVGWLCLAARFSARSVASPEPARLATLRWCDAFLRSVFGNPLFPAGIALAGLPAALVTFVIVLRSQEHSAPWHPLQMRGDAYAVAIASAAAIMVAAGLFAAGSRVLIRRTLASPGAGFVGLMLVIVLGVGALLVPLSTRSGCTWAIGSSLPLYVLLFLDGPCIGSAALGYSAGYGGVFPLFLLTLFAFAPISWILAGAFAVRFVDGRAVRRIRAVAAVNTVTLGYAAVACFLAAAALVVAYPAYVPTPA